MKRTTPQRDVAVIRDPRGRLWTVKVLDRGEDDDLQPWLDLTPDERVELIGEALFSNLADVSDGSVELERKGFVLMKE